MMCKANLHDSNYCDNVLNNPEAGPRDNTDGFCPGHAPGFVSLTCPVYCQHRRRVCLVSTLLLGHASHDCALEASRKLPFIGLFFCPVLFPILTQMVYQKNAVSHITVTHFVVEQIF